MANLFSVDGYYKDDKSIFEGYLISAYDSSENEDSDIFYFGLSETDIIDIIKAGENNGILDFVITSYEVIE